MSDIGTAAKQRPTSEEPLIADILRRFSGFAAAHIDFDASKAEPALLDQYGIPPRPDAKTQPELRRIWDVAFGRPIRFAVFAPDPSAIRAVKFKPAPYKLGQTYSGSTRVRDSANWSGASITANHDKQFVQVWGTWKIPENLTLPPGAGPQMPGDPQYACSNWIGLDGQGLYFDSALPQIGTTAILQPNGQTVAEAWTQWWARGDQNTIPVPISTPADPFVVNPGNEIICVLTVIDLHKVHFAIGNLSTNPPQFRFINAIAPLVTLPNGITASPDISGSTAEWIIERPGIIHTDQLDKFPNYGETKFGLCVAVEAETESITALAHGRLHDLRGAELIRMFEVREHPTRTALISIPHRIDPTAFRVRYGDFDEF